jgi:hypothetical protein
MNLFALSPEQQLGYLNTLDELLRVQDDWQVLAQVYPQVKPHFRSVAERIVARLHNNPMTSDKGSVVDPLVAIAEVYFNLPHLDADYLKRRANAGRGYLNANHSVSTLIGGIYGIWIDEWTKTFAELFVNDPALLAKLNRALAIVSIFNATVVLEQFSYEDAKRQQAQEEALLDRFLKITGISRNLYYNMVAAWKDQ